MTWREHLSDFIFPLGLTDVYQFGVYSGDSMIDITELYRAKGIKLDNMYGFDSFEGLPEELGEPIAQECWKKGGFDAREKFGAKTVEDCVSRTFLKLETIIGSKCSSLANPCLCPEIKLIPGFFCDTLKTKLVEKYNMKPAAFVDLDADIYSSTFEALEFMCKNNLIVPGTLLAYDDWGGTPGWKEFKDGESRAHKEISEIFGMVSHQLVQFGREFPHVQTLFVVESIKKEPKYPYKRHNGNEVEKTTL